jgi:hypothetical protein
MSCFLWTCRLTTIVERILGLDSRGMTRVDDWDEQLFASQTKMCNVGSEADDIAKHLEFWRMSLPGHLEVHDTPGLSPLPHLVINLAVSGAFGWY